MASVLRVPAWCDVLYERREIFEATNKALSFVPTSEFPCFRHVMGRKGPRFHAAALAENAAVAERVLERIRADRPLSSQDFERETGPTKDWFGMPENAVRAVLEAYTVTGVIGLARRDCNLRYYDLLLERLLPAELLAQEVREREQLRHKMLSRYRAPRPARRQAAPAVRSTASPRRRIRETSGRGFRLRAAPDGRDEHCVRFRAQKSAERFAQVTFPRTRAGRCGPVGNERDRGMLGDRAGAKALQS